ncbi:MAG: hypothetical protein BroJett038_32990 [Chloroflexota bacterium]|nr:MAG: hypothetical protein BroJett038_32990 [Chloroflexota bacterium]
MLEGKAEFAVPVEVRLREKEREKREAGWARLAAPERQPGHRGG